MPFEPELEEKRRRKKQVLPTIPGWRFTDDIYDEEGNLLDFVAISPTGRSYFKHEFEGLDLSKFEEAQDIGIAAPRVKTEVTRLKEQEEYRNVTARLFPELFQPPPGAFQVQRPEDALIGMIESDPIGFIKSLSQHGTPEDVQTFLRMTELDKFPLSQPSSPVPGMDMSALATLAQQDFEGFLEKLSEGGSSQEKEDFLLSLGFQQREIDSLFGLRKGRTDEELLYAEYQRTGGKLDFQDWKQAGTPIRPEDELFPFSLRKGAPSIYRAAPTLENQRALLRQGGVSEDEIENIIRLSKLNLTAQQWWEKLPPESKPKDVLDAARLAFAKLGHQTNQFFTRTLPNVLLSKNPWIPREPGQSLDDVNKEARDRFRPVAAQNAQAFQAWIDKHPELQPRPEWAEGAFKNPSLLKDPWYWAYEFSSTAPFTVTALVVTFGVTAVAGPGAGIAAGIAVMTPAQASEMEDLMLQYGAPEDKAAGIGLLVGAAMSLVEVGGDLPLFKMIAPELFGVFKKNATNEIARMTMQGLFRKGVKIFTTAEVSETLEEIVQLAIQNAALKTVKENQGLFEGITDTGIKTLIATAPFALFGAGVSVKPEISRVVGEKPGVAPAKVPGITPTIPEKPGVEKPIIPKPTEPVVGKAPRIEIMERWDSMTTKERMQMAKTSGKEWVYLDDTEREAVLNAFRKQVEPKAVVPGIEPPAAEAAKIIPAPEVYPAIVSHPSGQGYAVKVGKNSWISGGAGAFGGGNIGRFSTQEIALAEAKRLGYRISKVPAIPKAEPGMPEAGIQPSMLPEEVAEKEFRPAGKGKVTQISMDEQLKLEQARRVNEAEGLKAFLEQDPVATYTFKMGNRNVGLESLISIREQSFPEYFTVKQAQALNPQKDFAEYTQKGTKQYNHVPKDVALDDLTKQFNMTPDEIAERVMQIRRDRVRIRELSQEVTAEELGITEAIEEQVTGEEAGLPYLSVPEETTVAMPGDVRASEDRVVMPPPPPKEPPPPEPPRTHPPQPAPIKAGRITMPDLQAPQTVVDMYSRPDIWRRVANLPLVRKAVGLFNPAAVANNPAQQAIILRAALKDEGAQKAQAVMSHLWEIGTQERVWGKTDEMGLLTKEPFVGLSLDDIRQNPQKSLPFMTEQQKEWIKRASEIEKAKLEVLKRNEIEINELSFEDGGEYAGRRVMGKFNDSGELIESGRIGVGGRVGAKMPFEKTRIFKEASDGIIAGYRYMNSDEALYYNTIGAYNKIADKQMAEWILSKVDWRTTKAPEVLVLQAEAARLRLRKAQQLLAAVNRAVRGERVPSNTINSIATAYADQADTLNALIPELQKPSPETANIVKTLSAEAKALISEARVEYYQAVNERARAREEAMRVKYEEASIAHPAFAGKIFTGQEAKEIADILNRGLTPQFIEALGGVNKVNAIGRFFMLAGDVSPMTIQLQFLAFYRPVAYAKAMGGFVRAMYDPEFQYRYYANNRDLINRHPTLILSGRGTEFTEFMGRGGLGKKLGVLAKPLVPFQKAFEGSIDVAGIELAKSLDHLATTPERTLDVDQFINEFRGITSSARIGVSSTQRQVETAILLAPRYNRAIAAYLFDIVHGGVRGKLARMSLAQGLAGISAMAVAISIALGEDEDEIWQHFDIRSPKFFTWDVLGVKIGLGGKVRSILKTFGNMLRTGEVGQPALNFLRGNLSPGASTGLDLLTGKNYIGEPTRDNVLNFSRTILRNFMMIWTQTFLMEGGTLKEKGVIATAEFLGLRGYDISAKKELKIKDLADRLGELVGKTPVLSKKKPDIYDTRNIFSDVKTLLKNIPPEDVLADKGFAPWGHLVVYIEKSEPKTLPDIALKDYNFDKAKGDTFADYTAQWTERQRIEGAGERAVYVRVKIVEGKEERTTFKGLEALNAHKVDYPNAQRGNLSKRDRELLLEYNAAVDKKQFIKDHPQLGENPRIEALRKDTELNAKLAIFGQARIYSREANKKAWALVKELDIPDSALPPGFLVPKEIEDAYFDYEDTVDKWGATSPEAKLARASNDKLTSFLNEGRTDKLDEIDEPIDSLKIRANPKFRDISDRLKALSDEDSPDFKDDKVKDEDGLTARDRARKELLETKVDGDLTFRDLGRKIEATNKGTKEKPTDEVVVKKHIEFMRMQDEEGVGAFSAEVMLFRVDNPDYEAWRTDKEIWGDQALKPVDQTKVRIWRLDVKYRAEDEEYDALPSERRDAYLNRKEAYRRDRRRREAYGKGISEDLVEDFVNYWEQPVKGYRQERILFENPQLAAAMGLEVPKRVPDVRYDILLEQEDRTLEEDWEMEAYKLYIPNEQVGNYVQYQRVLEDKGTPYDDDWFLMENMDFYRNVYLGFIRMKEDRRDFRKVPSREVYDQYLEYLSLPIYGNSRLNYRREHPELQTWGELTDKWESLTKKKLTPEEAIRERYGLPELERKLAGLAKGRR